MTADELRTAYEMFKQIQFDCKTDEQKYNRHYTEQVDHDQEYFVKFTSWVKQAYPDVWEAWRAIQDVGRA